MRAGETAEALAGIRGPRTTATTEDIARFGNIKRIAGGKGGLKGSPPNSVPIQSDSTRGTGRLASGSAQTTHFNLAWGRGVPGCGESRG